jgi:hypothetical protein
MGAHSSDSLEHLSSALHERQSAVLLDHWVVNPYPPCRDALVQAVQLLLAKEGGHRVVGAKAGISDQSLYQIAYLKVDSKTGKPKSVGPSIRSRLDKHYPGWLDKSTGVLRAAEPDLVYLARTTPSLNTALQITLSAFSALTPGKWQMVRARLDALPGHPETTEEVLSDIAAVLGF